MKYYIVDVFCEEKYSGNQLAVVLLEKEEDKEVLQKIAREFNFSESTFIVPGGKEGSPFPVRIFTPMEELPFAGHPTLGTSFVIKYELIKKDIANLELDLPIGNIPVTFEKHGDTEIIWMKQIEPEFLELHKAEDIAPLVGIDPSEIDGSFPIQAVSTGLPTMIIPLKSLEAIEKVACNTLLIEKYFAGKKTLNLLLFTGETYMSHNQINCRMFAPELGILEDPATGSANGCLAAYLVKHSYFGSQEIDIRVEQGYQMGRKSLLYLRAAANGPSIEVNVGGSVIKVAEGHLC